MQAAINLLPSSHLSGVGASPAFHRHNFSHMDFSSSSQLQFHVFAVFQQELDTKHDKYERLVKISRDVTIESKRTIFLLHRVARYRQFKMFLIL